MLGSDFYSLRPYRNMKLMILCLVGIMLLPFVNAACTSDSDCQAPQRCQDCSIIGLSGNCCLYYSCTSDSECRNGEYCTDDGVCHLKVGGMFPKEQPMLPIEPIPGGPAEPMPEPAPSAQGTDLVPILLAAIVVVLIVIAIILLMKKK